MIRSIKRSIMYFERPAGSEPTIFGVTRQHLETAPSMSSKEIACKKHFSFFTSRRSFFPSVAQSLQTRCRNGTRKRPNHSTLSLVL